MGRLNKKVVKISNIRASDYESEVNKRKKFEERQKRMAENGSNIRVELHTYITKELSAGQSKEEILKYLRSEKKFESLSDFFESYVDDHIKKIERDRQGKAPKRAEWDR